MKGTATRLPRRSKAEMGNLLSGVLSILGEYDERITIRHCFYRCVGAGLVRKTENDYDNLRKALVNWRRNGAIEIGAFSDGTRWRSICRTWEGERNG